MVTKRKKISVSKYNNIMEKIIAKGMPVHETLITMLDKASEYDIIWKKDKKRKKK